MHRDSFGVGLILFLVYAICGFLTEVFQVVFGLAIGSLVTFGGGSASDIEAVSEFNSGSLLAGLAAMVSLYGILLVARRSRSAPGFWSVLLIVVALLHLYDALAREGGLYSIGLALAAAGWQVFWMHSESVRRVFGTKGFGF